MLTNNYSGSKCPSCKGTTFETVVETPTSSNYKLQFIRCYSCKTVVGVTEFFNIGALIDKIFIKLGIQ